MSSASFRIAFLLLASGMTFGSIAFAQSGAAAPGGAVPSAAPGGAVPSVAPGGAVPSAAPGGVVPSAAPGGAIPSAAPGTFPGQAAPGTLPQQAAPGGNLPQPAAPGSLPQQAAPGGAPAFTPSNNPGNNTTPANAAATTGAGQNTSGQSATTAAGGTSAASTNATTFNGTPTTLGLNFATDGNGLRLSGVTGDSFAQQAGLLAGDQILGVNGQTVKSQAELQSAMRRAFDAGAPLSIFVRRNGQIQSIGIPLPSTAAGAAATTNDGTTANANAPGFMDALRFSTGAANGGITSAGGANGLQVAQISPNSWAAQAGVQVNDRIVGVDGQTVTSDLRLTSMLQTALTQNPTAQLTVNRNGVMTPLTVNRPDGFRPTSTMQATGNFNTDFGQFAGDFSQSIQRAQQQFQQLNAFNDRISTLRGLIMSSTGQSADNVRILEQLRSLRADMATFNAQTGGVMQPQVQEFLTRLNQLNPSFAEATNNAVTPTSAPTGTAGNSATPATVPSTATSPPTNTPR